MKISHKAFENMKKQNLPGHILATTWSTKEEFVSPLEVPTYQ